MRPDGNEGTKGTGPLSAARGPVAEHERIFTLDALRGFAIFGVLVANAFSFAAPAWLPPAPPAEAAAGADQAVLFAVEALVMGKFYVLFSLLFGMGLALQSARAAAAARPLKGIFRRRLGLLFFFGVVHGVLVYSGDILAFYAFLGWIAFALRRASTRTLLAVAIALFVAGQVAFGAYAASHPDSPTPGMPDWRQLADERRAVLTPAPADFRLAFYELMADERRLFSSGTWWQQTRHRTAAYFLVGWPFRMVFLSWLVLATFVFGMYLVRHSVFLERAPARGGEVLRAVGGGVIGLFLQGLGLVIRQTSTPGSVVWLLSLPALFVGAYVLSFSYAGAVAGLCRSGRGRTVLGPMAAVGRMALTNYLASSVVFGLVFYGALFGRLGAGRVVLVALALYAAELVWSPLWLRSFRFGPFEWLWRSATYRRLQPTRRRPTQA